MIQHLLEIQENHTADEQSFGKSTGAATSGTDVNSLIKLMLGANMDGILGGGRDSTGSGLIGKHWTGSEFITPADTDTNTYLHITASTNPLAINTNITVNVAIKDASGNIVNVNGTYYVPVVQKVSNVAIDLLDIVLVNGQATKTFQISAKGIYSIVMSAVSPVPTSILADNVELIVI